MITRDSAASVKGNAQNARQRLGQAIEHYMHERKFDDRRVARTCSSSPKEVEQWREGKLVPTSDQWRKLKRSVAYGLDRFSELYQRARQEAEAEARERAARSEAKPETKINTALGDKLAKITDHTPPPPRPTPPLKVVPTEPEPAPAPEVVHVSPSSAVAQLGVQPRTGRAADGRALPPPRPTGSTTTDAVERRKRFVRELIAQRPQIRTTGRDSVIEAVRKTFGIGISPKFVEDIRAEILAEENARRLEAEREQIRAELLGKREPIVEVKPTALEAVDPTPITAQAIERALEPARDAFGNQYPTPIPTTLEQAARVTEERPGDVEAAVQLILEALPNLQTFTISVDENGEASFDYQIRKVRIETVAGSGKVKR